MEDLTAVARDCDRRVAEARADLVAAVRRAHKEGMTQLEIARRVGRSQPEVSRLLKFHGSTGLARTVRRHAPEVRAVITEAGGRNVRVFGSVATGEDGPESDVDLLFSAGEQIGRAHV